MDNHPLIHLWPPHRICWARSFSGNLPIVSNLEWQDASGGFFQLPAPLPSPVRTGFLVFRNDAELFLIIAATARDGAGTGSQECVEVGFCAENDGLTRWHYVLDSFGKLETFPYSPGDEVYSSRFEIPKAHVARVEDRGGTHFYTLGFSTAGLFSKDVFCGLHVARSAGRDYSSWTFCSGNGGQDASSYGRLYRECPTVAGSIESAQWHSGSIELRGASSLPALSARVIDPLGSEAFHTPRVNAGHWDLALRLKSPLTGRYRVQLSSVGTPSEPIEFAIDIRNPRANHDSFRMAITNDPPMCMRSGPYSPARFNAEMKLLADHRVRRLHWIDFDPLLRHWHDPRWNAHLPATLHSCEGNLLRAAVTAARPRGIEVIADLKIFDMGANMFWTEGPGDGNATELEGLPFCLAPEIASNPQLAWQLPEGVKQRAQFPIRKITIFSEERIAPLNVERLRLFTSADNRSYTPYSGEFAVRQGQLDRPHQRWTPLGTSREEGSRVNWFVEFSDLATSEPYLALRMEGAAPDATHRGFLLVEAVDASGQLAPLTLATAQRNSSQGNTSYLFWKDWFGWHNRIDPLFLSRRWALSDLGMTFQLAPRISALLEPTDENAQQIWLSWIDRVLADGADGVSIRTLCHHNGFDSYRKYAWGPAVVRTFKRQHHREPALDGRDDRGMRELRGEAYLEFLRKASERVRNAGKRFCIQLESGFELPGETQTRMQFPIRYRDIIEEGLVDEIALKWFTAYHPWLHENVLPLARKKHIAAQVISRNLHPVSAFHLPQTLPRLVEDARAAGWQGYNLYELVELLQWDTATESACFHEDVHAALNKCTLDD